MKIRYFIKIGDRKVFAKPEEDTERTSEDGKASSVHFLHFEFDEDLVQLFINGDNDVIIGFDHPNYKHFSEISITSKKKNSQTISMLVTNTPPQGSF